MIIRGWKKDEFSAPFAIWEVKILDTKCKITYLYLASRFDSDGQATPSFSEIAEACSFSVRSAKYAVATLEKVGLLRRINRWKGPKQRDTNLYILYHPEQIGLISRTLPPSAESAPQGSANNAPPSAESAPQGSANNAPPSAESAPNNMLVGLSVVGKLDDVDKINIVWKEAFGERLNKIRAEGLIEYGKESGLDVEGIIKIIKDIAIHMDSFKKSPYATVLTAVKQGGWNFDAPAPKPNPKRKGKRSDQKEDDLPRAIRKQMEQEAEGYKESEVDPEVEKEIQEELKRMRERFKRQSS